MGKIGAEKKTRKKHFKMFPQKVLDAGEIKILNEINMKPQYIRDFEIILLEARALANDIEKMDLLPRYIQEKWNKIQEDQFLMFFLYKDHCDKFWQKGCPKIAEYMGVKPFVTSVMINISPNWKGKFGQDSLTDKLMVKKFRAVVETYLKASSRYGRYKYNLECGSGGDHLHAHIVAEFNPKCVKSVTTHINKGNHTVEIRKIWDKIFPEGYVGLLKGKFAVQRIILRNEELLKDKLNYLVEELKPEGHKNL